MAGVSGIQTGPSGALTRSHPWGREGERERERWDRSPNFQAWVFSKPHLYHCLHYCSTEENLPGLCRGTQDLGAKSQEYLAPRLLVKAPTSGASGGSKGTGIECPPHARHYLGAPPSGTDFTLTGALQGQYTVISILHTRKQSPKEELARSHTAGKWYTWDLNPDLLSTQTHALST